MASKRCNRNAIVTVLAVAVVIFGCGIQVRALLNGNFMTLPALALYFAMGYLFVCRKPVRQSTGGGTHWIFALCGTYGPFLLQPAPNAMPVLKYIGLALLALGILQTFTAIFSLGKGFGIIAANRQIKTHGAYRLVRHPLYIGEGLWFLALVLQNLNLYNAILFILQSACQLMRIRAEEALLSQDETYKAYMEKVKYRLLPGIY